MEKQVQIIPANDRHEDVLGLMREYVDWLMVNDDKMQEVLANQHLDDEIADFNTKYAPPEGRLYLALLDGEPVGCIALTKISAQTDMGSQTSMSSQTSKNSQTDISNQDNIINQTNETDQLFVCESKRLYVRPSARGHKIGKLLMDKIIADAKEIGYSYMRLDSFPFMKSAVKMYDYYGFYPIGNYCNNPSENAIFRELDLNK